MRARFIIGLCLVLTLTSTNHAPWPLSLFFFLSLLLPHLLKSWLVPGGSAWSKAHNTAHATAPGPSGWPILGSIPIMGPLAHRKLAALANSHKANRLMSLSLGTTPVVISSHPETAKQILSGPSFSDRPVKTSARLLMFERAIGFAPSGEYWRRLRRIAATSMFSPRRIAASENLRRRSADEMIDQVSRQMEGGGRVVLRDVLKRGSLEGAVESAFGGSLGEGEKGEVYGMVREGYELIGRLDLGDHFGVGGILDFYGVGRRCEGLAARVRVLFGRVVEERRRGGELAGDDFLSVLLGLPTDEGLSDSDVIAVLWVSTS